MKRRLGQSSTLLTTRLRQAFSKTSLAELVRGGFRVLLSGNIVVEVDDGAEVLLSPAMSWYRTELATVGAWLGRCRPSWLLSSSEAHRR